MSLKSFLKFKALFCILFTLSSWASHVQVTIKGGVNIRAIKSNGRAGGKVGKALHGEKLEVIRKQGKYYIVKYKNQERMVWAKAVEDSPTESESEFSEEISPPIPTPRPQEEDAQNEACLECLENKPEEDQFPQIEPIKEIAEKMSSITEPCDFSNIGQDAELNKKRSLGCQKILENLKEIGMSEESYLYTLELFKNLHTGKFDLSCGKSIQPDTPQIKNSCQFGVVDLNQKVKSQSKAFQVDICSGKVKTFMMNRAKKSNSTLAKTYSDKPNAFRTSVGAYLTAGKEDLRQFVPYNNRLRRRYSKVVGWKAGDERCSEENIWKKRECPAIRLSMYGLHTSNNDTASGKPMHVSAFPSSGGCDSVEKKDEGVIYEFAEDGPTLVVNWGPKEFHRPETTKECKND